MIGRLLLLSLANTVLYLVLGFTSELPTSARWLPQWSERAPFETSPEFALVWLALVLVYALGVRAASTGDGGTLLNLVFLTSALFRGILFFGGGFDMEPRSSMFYAPSPSGVWLSGALSTPWVQRATVTAFDLGAIGVSASLLRRLKLPVGLILLHGWNPLVIKEAAGSGRVGIVAIFFLVAALRLAQARAGAWWSTLSFAVSATGPAIVLAAAPALTRSLGARVLVAVAAAGISRYFRAPQSPWSAWIGWPPGDYLGGSIAPCLAGLSRLLVTRDPTPAFVAAIALWGAVIAIRHIKGDLSGMPQESLIAVGGLLLVSPQVLPEAFVAVAMLSPYGRNRGWLALTATAPLTYVATATQWSFFLGFAQYFVPYFLLLFFWLGKPAASSGGGPTRGR